MSVTYIKLKVKPVSLTHST